MIFLPIRCQPGSTATVTAVPPEQQDATSGSGLVQFSRWGDPPGEQDKWWVRGAVEKRESEFARSRTASSFAPGAHAGASSCLLFHRPPAVQDPRNLD